MTLHKVLTGINEIQVGLEEIKSCLKCFGERVARIEAWQQGHNGPVSSAQPVSDQKIGGDVGRLTEKDSTKSHEVQHNQDVVPAELPGQPDVSRVVLTKIVSPRGQHLYTQAESDLPALPPPSDASPVEASGDSQALRLQSSLRGGWGDEEAEEILYKKLANIYYSSDIHRHLSPLEKQLAEMTKQLSSVLQCGLTPASREHAQSPDNAQFCESSQTPVPTSSERVLPKNCKKPRYVEKNPRKPFQTPKTTRPVFGLPSTPSRRVVSFDISSSPFAMYSNENSPFLQLAKKRGSTSGVFEGGQERVLRLGQVSCSCGTG
ncbi:hypothetical protein PMIN06_002747 [Paraphaeosphaeria minitans]